MTQSPSHLDEPEPPIVEVDGWPSGPDVKHLGQEG